MAKQGLGDRLAAGVKALWASQTQNCWRRRWLVGCGGEDAGDVEENSIIDEDEIGACRRGGWDAASHTAPAQIVA